MGVLDAPPSLSASPSRIGYTRSTNGRVMFIDDPSTGIEGRFNDGIGSAFIDWDAQIAGGPSIRLDNQGFLSPAATNGSCTGKANVGSSPVTLTTTSSVNLPVTLNSPSTLGPASTQQNLAQSGFFQFMAADGNTYMGSYTGYLAYSNPTLTLTGCKLLTPTQDPADITGASVGVKLYTPQTATSVTVPTYSTSASLGTSTSGIIGYVIIGNPFVNCGLSPITTGVVFKRRWMDNENSKFGIEMPMRYTATRAPGAQVTGSGIGISNFAWSYSIYNRDGANYYCARVMLQTNVLMQNGTATTGWSSDNAILWVASGGTTAQPTMTPLGIITKTSFNQHGWDPYGQQNWDRAGGWNTMKTIADFKNQIINSVQMNDLIFPVAMPMPSVATKGAAKMLHFSTELVQSSVTGNTSSRAFVNVGPLTGTLE